MRDESLPCSVITSHGEPPDSSSTRTNVLEETICVVNTDSQNEHHQPCEDTNPVNCRSANSTVWSGSVVVKNNNTDAPSRIQQSGRIRKQKRPYSPTLIEKAVARKTSSLKSKSTEGNEEGTEKHQKPFECEKCSSPYVVNPARSHSAAKTYAPRRVFDPVTKKTFIVCNACRLSVARSRKAKRIKKQSVPTEEQKVKFLEECDKFSRSLVEQLKDSDASRLYCPVLSLRPCNCLQKYISDGDSEEQSAKALHLLSLLKKAKKLSAEKNSFGHVQSPCPRGLLNRKSRAFEEFVQEMRQYLRHKLKFCERGCQQVLMYSNNFLHKQLKSAPDQTARIQHLGGSSRQQLCPISKIANENCCQDRCVLMALSHSHLLEEWRATARRSQRDARRVLAEMLTPSGGTKANCFKFIRMVTGCSHTTICLVNEQMWRTKGNREPPEHGLRRWWRQQACNNSGEGGGSDSIGEALAVDNDVDLQSEGEDIQDGRQDNLAESEESVSSNVADVHIPTARELRELAPAEAGRRLLQQRRKLATIQRQLAQQQRHLAELRQQRPPLVLGCCSGTGDVQQCINNSAQSALIQQQATPAQAVTRQPQVVHVLEIPATPASVITSHPDSGQQQSTVSVLSSSGEFEPVANISVNLSPGQPMGTVIFVPEFEAVTTVSSDHPPSGNIFNSNAAEIEALHLQQNATQPKHVHLQVPGQTHTQIPVAAHTAHVQSAVPSASQPVHLPPVQFHVPLDVPIQVAVQSQVDLPSLQLADVPTSNEQPPSAWAHQIILPSSQPVASSSNSTQNQVSLQGAPTAVVNVINKDNQYVQTVEPQVYYLETVNCVTSVPD